MTRPQPIPEIPCPTCGSPMVSRSNANGNFYGCSKFPQCRSCRTEADGNSFLVGKSPIIAHPPKVGRRSSKTSNLSKKAADASRAEALDLSDKFAQQRAAKKKALAEAAAEREFEPIPMMPGSEEQELIWQRLLESKAHLVVNAFAGTGKTWTSIQGVLRAPKTWNIGFCAFNVHIAKEGRGKLRASGCSNVTSATQHSLGSNICREAFPGLGDPNEYKTDEILVGIPKPGPITNDAWTQILSTTEKLINLAKGYLLDPKSPDIRSRLEEIADHHNIALTGLEMALDLVPLVLWESIRTADKTFDFNDMIWIPVVRDLVVPPNLRFDILFVDEYQDSNFCQQEFALRLLKPGGRLVIVGDTFQAIYGWRGSDCNAIPRMTERLKATPLGVEVLKLTVTRRCPKSHVALAQAIVPEITALPDAPDGIIKSMTPSEAVNEMRPGDLGICRVNAKLISTAFALIRRGIRPLVRGRNIGKGLLRLLSRMEKRAGKSVASVLKELEEHRTVETQKLSALGKKGLNHLQELNDQCDCLQEFLKESQTLEEARQKIDNLFKDIEGATPKDAVILGTIHRTKGLEAERVFILAPELIPHPMAKKDWEVQQERNLAYIAVTRSKFIAKNEEAPGTLIFCGPIPSIYDKPEATGQVKAME